MRSSTKQKVAAVCDNVSTALKRQWRDSVSSVLSFYQAILALKQTVQLLLTRWSHGTHNLNIHQVDHGAVLHVIPVPMIQPLAQQLHRGLGTIHLPCWHVHIIHKYHLIRQNISIQGAKIGCAVISPLDNCCLKLPRFLFKLLIDTT